VRKVRDWLILHFLSLSRREDAISKLSDLYAASSLTLNQKEEVKQNERILENQSVDSVRFDVLRHTTLHIGSGGLVLLSSCEEGSRWWRVGWKNTLGMAFWFLQRLIKALLSVWERLIDADGLLALPAKALCVVIMALITFSPYAVYTWCLNVAVSIGAPLCYLLYFLFLFYVSTLLIVGSVIGYLREGG